MDADIEGRLKALETLTVQVIAVLYCCQNPDGRRLVQAAEDVGWGDIKERWEFKRIERQSAEHWKRFSERMDKVMKEHVSATPPGQSLLENFPFDKLAEED